MLRPFHLEEIARTPFDPTSHQGTLFVGERPERGLGALEEWLSATPAAARPDGG